MVNTNIDQQNSARIFGQSGALEELLEKIHDPKVKTLEDVLQFRKTYAAVRQKMVIDSIAQVKLQIPKMMAEINQLSVEKDEATKRKSEELNGTISRLEGELARPHPQRSFFSGVYYQIKGWAQDRKIKYFRTNFQKILRDVTSDHDKRIGVMANKIKYTENNVKAVAEGNISSELHRLDDLNGTIEQERSCCRCSKAVCSGREQFY